MAELIIYSHNTALSLELLTAAILTGQGVIAICINNDKQAEALKEVGANVYKVVTSNNIADTNAVAEILKKAVIKFDAETLFLSSDRRGKELAGRLAQKLEAGCLTDVKAISMNGADMICERNAFGGATIATQSINTTIKVLAISPKVFKPAQPADGGNILDFSVEEIPSSIVLKEIINKNADDVDIADAEILIAVGCGVQKEENLKTVEAVAESLGALVGCSKPVATDWKWFKEERIIGLSGNICNPNVALILGVSGQVQFTVGVRAARIIISINIDENAPMNALADYYLVGDLNEVLPELKGVFV